MEIIFLSPDIIVSILTASFVFLGIGMRHLTNSLQKQPKIIVIFLNVETPRSVSLSAVGLLNFRLFKKIYSATFVEN